MRVLRSLEDAANARLRRPIVTLGVFDGVHVGHRFLIDHLVSLSRERAADAVVVTFSVHPRAVIRSEAPQLITSLRHRLKIFESLGVTASLVLDFDADLQRMPARDFARRVFADALAAQIVLLGYNNRFGRGGEGDFSVLAEIGRERGFEARAMSEVRIGEQAISSTAIRKSILEGDVERASLLLGRPFSVLGEVVHGDGLGRKLGFPTANLDLQHEVRPPRGVYGCEVWIEERRAFGLVNIGIRPTVTSPNATGEESDPWVSRDRSERVEVHILDGVGDIYGKDVELVFLTRLRPEVRFDGVDALKRQIGLDVANFRAWLSDRGQSVDSRIDPL